jgi:hypothetical protein
MNSGGRERVYVSPTPYRAERIYAAAMYCSDGRIGDQIDEFLHLGIGFPRYDRLVCPGGPVALSGRLMALWDARGVEEQVRFLVQIHDIKTVVLVAHEGCAYYAHRLAVPPARIESEQREDLRKAAEAIARLAPGVTVTRYFARHVGTGIGFEPA